MDPQIPRKESGFGPHDGGKGKDGTDSGGLWVEPVVLVDGLALGTVGQG
jgi:hypothetical protein